MTAPNLSLGTEPPRALASRLQRLGATLAGIGTKLGTAAAGVVTAGIIALCMVVFWRTRATPVLVIEQVSIPPALVSKSVSAVTLTHELADLIDSVKRAALPSAEQRLWKLDSEIAVPDVEVPIAKAPLPKLVSLIDEALGRDALHVSWEVGAGGVDAGAVWVVSAHMPGRPGHEAQIDLAKPHAALAAIARGILSDAEPLILARALLNDRHCGDAQTIAARLLRLEALRGDQRSAALNLLGQAALCTGATPTHASSMASRYFRASIEDDSENPLPHANLGALFADRAADTTLDEPVRRAARDSMDREYRRAALLAPANPGVQESWGRSLVLVGRPDSAIAHLDSAIQREPRLPLAYLWRAYGYHELGRLDRALTDYARGIARDPDNVATLKAYGHALIEVQDWLGAIGAFERVVQLDSTDVDARYYYGCSMRHTDSTSASGILVPLALDERVRTVYRIAALTALRDRNTDCRRG